MKKILLVTGLVCLILGVCIALLLGSAMSNTSSAEYCMSCHYHEQADTDWKKSEHFVSKSGVVTSCTECHLPPQEDGFFKYHMIKSRTGAKHMWKKITTSKENIDWEAMASHKRALSMLSISDHIFTGEGLTAEERQDSFRQMMETALETAWEFA